MRKHSLPNYADDPADQNSGADHECRAAGAFAFTVAANLDARKTPGALTHHRDSLSCSFASVQTGTKVFVALLDIEW